MKFPMKLVTNGFEKDVSVTTSPGPATNGGFSDALDNSKGFDHLPHKKSVMGESRLTRLG
jgi:hypothetical protein